MKKIDVSKKDLIAGAAFAVVGAAAGIAVSKLTTKPEVEGETGNDPMAEAAADIDADCHCGEGTCVACAQAAEDDDKTEV